MPDLVVCTVITRSYLAYARVLAHSLRHHHPELRLVALVADRDSEESLPSDGSLDLLPASVLPGLPERQASRFYYLPSEFCKSVRAAFLAYALESLTTSRCVYLDADVLVCNALDPLFEATREAPIVVTPHVLEPGDATPFPPETKMLRYGLFNSGFLGISRSSESARFLTWWNDRTLHSCTDDPLRGLYVDQKWLDLLPLFFPHYRCVTHRGANIGHWNLHERAVRRTGGGLVVSGGQPLLFLHFSGWDIRSPEVFSRWGASPDGESASLLAECGRRYRDLLLRNGYEEEIRKEGDSTRFSDGSVITAEMRRAYHGLVLDGQWPGGSPFDDAGRHILESRLAQQGRP